MKTLIPKEELIPELNLKQDGNYEQGDPLHASYRWAG